jgi:nicotinamidase-related amidase
MLPASSTLDSSQAVLVVVDIQDRLSAVMERRQQVLSKTRLLIAAARITGVPLIATRQNPKGLGEMEPGVVDALAEAENGGLDVEVIDKMSFDCFAEPAFSDAVAATGRRQLLLAGMEAHICVCQTALSGLRETFDVHIAADACCSIDEECRTLAWMRLANAGAVITTAESAAYELVGRAGTDDFRALLQVVKASARGESGAVT